MKVLMTIFFLCSISSLAMAEQMPKINLPQISSFGPNAKADRKIASSPSAVAVFKVEGSQFEEAEKWVDSSNGVVCYSVGAKYKKSISCVKSK